VPGDDIIFAAFNNTVLRSLISGCIAALLSYYISSKALKMSGEKVIIYLSPILEELFKTGLAIGLKAEVLLSHITFGIWEALYDIRTNEGSTAYWAGFASIISHSTFGAITQYCIYLTDNKLLGIGIAAAIHMAWNYKIIEFRNNH